LHRGPYRAARAGTDTERRDPAGPLWVRLEYDPGHHVRVAKLG
jgi:hypothetical protein